MSTNTHGGTRQSDPKIRAQHRDACIQYVRDNPNCRLVDVCQGTGLSQNLARHHLHWASVYGYIKANGHSRGARWSPVAVEATNTAALVPTAPSVERNKDKVSRDALRREILSYIRSHGPVTTREVCRFFSMTKGALYNEVRYLSQDGCIKSEKNGTAPTWQFVQMLARPEDAPTAPSVGITPERKFFEPGPVITKIEAGVKYTYQAAPKGRFHVDLPPTGGVISAGHPRLTAALTQRTAQV